MYLAEKDFSAIDKHVLSCLTFIRFSKGVKIVCFKVTDSDLGQAKVSQDKLNKIQHTLKTMHFKSQSADDIQFLPASLSYNMF